MEIKVSRSMEISPEQIAKVLLSCNEKEFKSIFLKVNEKISNDKKEMVLWRSKGRSIGSNPGGNASIPINILYQFSQHTMSQETIDNGDA